jgi:hypothetical protein
MYMAQDLPDYSKKKIRQFSKYRIRRLIGKEME